MQSNLFGGTLPSDLADMTALSTLFLHSNSITGTVPRAWSELSHHLDWLWLFNNSLGGPVPPFSHPILSCVLQRGEKSETNCFSECPIECCHDNPRCHESLSVRTVSTAQPPQHEAMLIAILSLSIAMSSCASCCWLATRAVRAADTRRTVDSLLPNVSGADFVATEENSE